MKEIGKLLGKEIERKIDKNKLESLPKNAMLRHRVELFNEWDFEKNDELGLDVYEITYGSNKVAWWIGKCGHSWDNSPKGRVGQNQGCPYCSNHRVLKGFNDMWTTNPETARLLLNKDDGYVYSQFSGQRVDWKCGECGEAIKDKVISSISSRRLSCPTCSDHISFPQRVLASVLKTIKIDFSPEKVFVWSEDKRYDFYLPKFNCIIEVHGDQHYRGGFDRAGGKGLKEEQKNDKLKKRLARENGITTYITIDARVSEIDYIKKSIESSYFAQLFNIEGLDWQGIAKKSTVSLAVEVWDLWNGGMRNPIEIGKELNLGEQVVRRLLKRGTEAGKCNYAGAEYRLGTSKVRRVVQLDLKGKLIRVWKNATTAAKELNLLEDSILDGCKKERVTMYGFIWMFEDDYNSKAGKEVVKESVLAASKHRRRGVRVVQLSLKGEFIREWESMRKAEQALGVNGISSVCRGIRKTTGGFRWMYKEDYDKELKEE